MTPIEWSILIACIGIILGGLFLLRDSAGKLVVTREQLERIRKRRAESEEEEQPDEEDRQ